MFKKYPTKHKPEGIIALFPILLVFKLVFARFFHAKKMYNKLFLVRCYFGDHHDQ